MIEAPDFLPLGSIIQLKGNAHKLMIISRGVVAYGEDTKGYFDYAACLYPEGMQGEAFIYCNHDAIEEVFFRGFESEEDVPVIEAIHEALEGTTLERVHPEPIGEW